jgi:hypothetical protein
MRFQAGRPPGLLSSWKSGKCQLREVSRLTVLFKEDLPIYLFTSPLDPARDNQTSDNDSDLPWSLEGSSNFETTQLAKQLCDMETYFTRLVCSLGVDI